MTSCDETLQTIQIKNKKVQQSFLDNKLLTPNVPGEPERGISFIA